MSSSSSSSTISCTISATTSTTSSSGSTAPAAAPAPAAPAWGHGSTESSPPLSAGSDPLHPFRLAPALWLFRCLLLPSGGAEAAADGFFFVCVCVCVIYRSAKAEAAVRGASASLGNGGDAPEKALATLQGAMADQVGLVSPMAVTGCHGLFHPWRSQGASRSAFQRPFRPRGPPPPPRLTITTALCLASPFPTEHFPHRTFPPTGHFPPTDILARSARAVSKTPEAPSPGCALALV